jgi:hypothetical protein
MSYTFMLASLWATKRSKSCRQAANFHFSSPVLPPDRQAYFESSLKAMFKSPQKQQHSVPQLVAASEDHPNKNNPHQQSLFHLHPRLRIVHTTSKITLTIKLQLGQTAMSSPSCRSARPISNLSPQGQG